MTSSPSRMVNRFTIVLRRHSHNTFGCFPAQYVCVQTKERIEVFQNFLWFRKKVLSLIGVCVAASVAGVGGIARGAISTYLNFIVYAFNAFDAFGSLNRFGFLRRRSDCAA